ncbi:MAG TPA: FecR domain-containing protein [Puia sp.]|nr:FecR domain-containing protein [Puia sp.]
MANECHNAEEANEIAAYLEAHPNVLEKWMPEGDLLKEQALAQGEMPVPSGQMLRGIRQNAYGHSIRFWIGTAAAAVVAGLIVGGVVLSGHNDRNPVAAQVAQHRVDQHMNTFWKTIRNTTDSSRRLTMEDSSEIVMEPGTTLEYQPPFASNRYVRLKGIAYFKVTKDARHPFSVAAGGYVTKVLGTSFRIWAVPGRKDVRIALYSGKVDIDKVDASNGQTFTPLTLTPGQQVTFDKNTSLAKLTPIPGIPSQMNSYRDSSSVTAGGNLMFHQTRLSTVFRQLEQRYGVSISFPPKETDHLDFTGTIYKEDDINIILKNLSGLYNLTLLKNDTGFTIKK